MKIALASPRVAKSWEEGLERVRHYLAEAAERGAAIVCFPEAYLPGLRGVGIEVLPYGREEQTRITDMVAEWCRSYRIAAVLGMEILTAAGRQIAACVLDAGGRVLGYQTKNQLDPTEEPNYVPGGTRRLFAIEGLTFGVATCHEGFRYPETVRWAAVRGAQVVFLPNCTGSDAEGPLLTEWCASANPYYEKAIVCRALENTIYVAGVNYAFRYQDSATCLITPSGECQAYLPYGEEGALVQEIDLSFATGLLASRYAAERYCNDSPA